MGCKKDKKKKNRQDPWEISIRAKDRHTKQIINIKKGNRRHLAQLYRKLR